MEIIRNKANVNVYFNCHFKYFLRHFQKLNDRTKMTESGLNAAVHHDILIPEKGSQIGLSTFTQITSLLSIVRKSTSKVVSG